MTNPPAESLRITFRAATLDGFSVMAEQVEDLASYLRDHAIWSKSRATLILGRGALLVGPKP